MSKEKMDIIQRSTEQYKKLPLEKKMFILGIMQGILIEHKEDKVQQSGTAAG